MWLFRVTTGKPGNVREFETCQGNVRDVVNSQGIVREMSGKNLVMEKYPKTVHYQMNICIHMGI